jgi:hypothetical protein
VWCMMRPAWPTGDDRVSNRIRTSGTTQIRAVPSRHGGTKMNKEEFEKAFAEVAKRFGLYRDEQVDARLEAEKEQRRRGG